MPRTRHVLPVMLAAIVAMPSVPGSALPGQGRPASPDPGADRRGAALASRLLRDQQTPAFRARARLTVAQDGQEKAAVAQVRILGLQDAGMTRLLYQVVWPQAARGYALSIERPDAAAGSSGFLFEPPDRVVPLNDEVRRRAFLESDLLMEDLIEDFWRWPSQREAGKDQAGGEACTILESRPPAGSRSPYSLVRSWIADARPVPMRIDKFDGNGELARRMTFIAPSRRGPDGPLPARLVVEVPGSTRTTTIEYFGSERDLVISAGEFSVERLKRAVAGGK